MHNKVHEEVHRQLAAVEKQNRLLEISNAQATTTWENACNLMKKMSISETEMNSDALSRSTITPGVPSQPSEGFHPNAQFTEIDPNIIHQFPQPSSMFFITPSLSSSNEFRYLRLTNQRGNPSAQLGIVSRRSRIRGTKQRGKAARSLSTSPFL